MMNETGAPFSIYPYGYEDELAKKRAANEAIEFEERHRLQLADELSVDLGVVAMAAFTGIAGPEYKESAPVQPTIEQSRKLGQAPLRSMITIDGRPSFLTSLQAEQLSTVNEQAVLGHADRQAA